MTAKALRTVLWLAAALLGPAVSGPGYSDQGGQTATSAAVHTGGRVLRVGPMQAIRHIADAAAQARDGDTVEIDAGDYVADVAVWVRDQLTVRGVGGQVRLIAAGASAERKAIWVLRGGSMTVENIDFIGTRVPDRNGAGIRFEKGHLIIRNCRFEDNENGILTGGNKDSELEIEDSEFGNNGAGDGQSHNLYVGALRRLTVTGSYFHHARVGHLLKSRAAENFILYNRLTDEIGGRASYELEFPAGGVAYVIGNIIQQGSQTENPNLISFAAEGYVWPRNELYLVNNTLVDDRPSGGNFLRVKPGAVRIKAVNNILVGEARLEAAGPGDYRNNRNVGWSEFVQASRQDYRLAAASGLRNAAVDPGEANGVGLAMKREYVHPRHSHPLEGGAHALGAVQSGADR
jgi:hypothetical protein